MAGNTGVAHFHIEGPGYRCSVTIERLEVIVGAAPAAVLRVVRPWARDNQAALRAQWKELNG